MKSRIIFNGKSYNDASEMPPEVRQAYERVLGLLADANRNGVPDLLESAGLGTVICVQENQIVVNGQNYSRPEDLPPAARQLFDQAMSQLGTAGSDLPQRLASLTGTGSGQPAVETSLQFQWGSKPAAGSGPGLARVLALAGAAILGFILVALWGLLRS